MTSPQQPRPVVGVLPVTPQQETSAWRIALRWFVVLTSSCVLTSCEQTSEPPEYYRIRLVCFEKDYPSASGANACCAAECDQEYSLVKIDCSDSFDNNTDYCEELGGGCRDECVGSTDCIDGCYVAEATCLSAALEGASSCRERALDEYRLCYEKYSQPCVCNNGTCG